MNEHHHLTLDMIAAIDAGQASAELIHDALANLCPQCLGVLTTYLDQCPQPAGAYANVLRRARERFPRLAQAVRQETDEALPAVEEYLRRPPAQRASFVASDPRCLGRAFVDHLLDTARSARRSDPAASLAFATDATAALDRQPRPWIDHRILALALGANARRATGDFRAAALGFARARSLAEEHGAADAETAAELDRLEASLLIDQRRFQDAQAMLARALETYQELGQVTLTAETLIKLGHLFSSAGAPETAIGPYRAALEIVSEETEPQLYLAARLNLSHALFELGDIIHARDLLVADEDAYLRFADDHIAIRRIWLEGRIYTLTGETHRAEPFLLQVRDTFAAQEHGFNAAIACLDLALLYQQLGRFDDLTENVATAVRLFSAYALHRDALAALVTLHNAAQERAVTAESIERVAGFLRVVAADPGARNQKPS